MITYTVYDIDWETDGYKIKLPNKVEVLLTEEENPSLEIASILSDKYGFLVNGFDYERKE